MSFGDEVADRRHDASEGLRDSARRRFATLFYAERPSDELVEDALRALELWLRAEGLSD